MDNKDQAIIDYWTPVHENDSQRSHLKSMREPLINLATKLFQSGAFAPQTQVLEIGARQNPLSVAFLSNIGVTPTRSMLVDPVYRYVNPPKLFPSTSLLFQGLPKDNTAILQFMQGAPTTLYLESVLNYLRKNYILPIMSKAENIVINNSEFAGDNLPTAATVLRSPGDILLALSDLGFNPASFKLELFDHHIYGVFQRY